MANLTHEGIFRALWERQSSRFNLSEFCFEEQLKFIREPGRFKTAVCSRRSGKTIACAADLIYTALNHADVVCLYITLSRVNAKRIVWPELLKINRVFDLGGHSNETELSIRFPNGSVIYASGAKDKSEIDNFRGLPLKKVYLDECQSFRTYIEELVDDVLSKALFDHAGTLCLIGTPGHVPAGYFYNAAHSPTWKHFSWSMFQNPHLEKKSGKTPMELIREDCERMGVGLDHPKIQRECFARWIVDVESLIFKYDREKNHYEALPALPGAWEYVLGVDLGHDDADAIAVLGWHPKVKEAYLVEEFIKAKQGITELADELDRLILKYKPLKVVMDTGGLGKKIAEEIRRRRGIPIQAAEKQRKMEYIELLNDAMRTKRFYAKAGSAFAQDCFLVEQDKDKSRVDRIIVSDKYHSDICDAVLYGFRECYHWLYEPEPTPIRPDTDAWFRREVERMEEAALEALHAEKADDFREGLDFNTF